MEFIQRPVKGSMGMMKSAYNLVFNLGLQLATERSKIVWKLCILANFTFPLVSIPVLVW